MSQSQNQDISKVIQPLLVMHQHGRLDDALKHYKNLLKTYPQHPIILCNMATIAFQQERITDGIKLMQQSLIADPNQAVAHHNLAAALMQQHRYDEAERHFLRSIDIKPTYLDAIKQLAGLYLRNNQFAKAHQQYQTAIAMAPQLAELYYYDAMALKHLNQLEPMLARLKNCIKIDPNYLDANSQYGELLIHTKKYPEAIAHYEQIVKVSPNKRTPYFKLGLAHYQLKQFETALTYYDQAFALNANDYDTLNNRGLALIELKRLDEALDSFTRAIQIDHNKPSAYNNKGSCLRSQNQLHEALHEFRLAIVADPNLADAHNNLGLTYMDLGRFEEALTYFNHALTINPNYAQVKFNLGVLKLRYGDYHEGWPLYESRWDVNIQGTSKLSPSWLGEELLIGKSIHIYAEQGLGDTLQFCRYIPLIKAYKPNHIMVEVQGPLLTLLQNTWAHDPQITVLRAGEKLPHVDCHCPIMSLPLVFKTMVDTIPAPEQYIHTDEKHLNVWAHTLGKSNKLRVGIVWTGAKLHKNDFNRSIQLRQLAPLLELDVEWYCLQKEIRSIDNFSLKRFPQVELHHKNISDFSDTAALIAQMDLVIAVDTSVAHLAGAMGKPVWLMLPFSADFRWLMHRDDSPWYPSMQLFRQNNYGVWDDVILRVKEQLAHHLANPQTSLIPED